MRDQSLSQYGYEDQLYWIVKEAINAYKSNKSKASLSNWQLIHHHGKEGMQRADVLLECLNRAYDYNRLKNFIDIYLSLTSL